MTSDEDLRLLTMIRLKRWAPSLLGVGLVTLFFVVFGCGEKTASTSSSPAPSSGEAQPSPAQPSMGSRAPGADPVNPATADSPSAPSGLDDPAAPEASDTPPPSLVANAPRARPFTASERAERARARVLNREGKHDEAFSLLARLVSAHPTNGRLGCEAGFVAHKAGHAKEATKWLNGAIARFGPVATVPESSRVPLAMCLYNRALVHLASHETEGAREALRKSLELRPNRVVERKLRDLPASPSWMRAVGGDLPPAMQRALTNGPASNFRSVIESRLNAIFDDLDYDVALVDQRDLVGLTATVHESADSGSVEFIVGVPLGDQLLPIGIGSVLLTGEFADAPRFRVYHVDRQRFLGEDALVIWHRTVYSTRESYTLQGADLPDGVSCSVSEREHHRSLSSTYCLTESRVECRSAGMTALTQTSGSVECVRPDGTSWEMPSVLEESLELNYRGRTRTSVTHREGGVDLVMRSDERVVRERSQTDEEFWESLRRCSTIDPP